jgi:hypothetical protein
MGSGRRNRGHGYSAFQEITSGAMRHPVFLQSAASYHASDDASLCMCARKQEEHEIQATAAMLLESGWLSLWQAAWHHVRRLI